MANKIIDMKIGEKLEKLDVINERLEAVDKRLESLGELSAGQCSYEMTGTFLNPARNCSHIVHEHPNATSGIVIKLL